MQRDADSVLETAREFDLGGDVTDINGHTAGHINDTYIVTVQKGSVRRRYTLQRINAAVFKRPDLVMHNIMVVTETIKRKNEERGGDPELGGLSLIPTSEGRHYLVDRAGDSWRCYRYIEGVTYDRVTCDRRGMNITGEAAGAFARFQNHLGDVDLRDVHTTIEDFHNTPQRFRRLCEVAAEDRLGRARLARREIEFVLSREPICATITGPLSRGELPTRVAHNDTKINNVIFDDKAAYGPRALCVIDLDTVMPGSALFDFGDLVRSSVCPRPEDETDLDTIAIDTGLFEAIVKGFLEGADIGLAEEEIRLTVPSSMVITFETGLRFLTDFLAGDVYFRTARPEHNLDRARMQFRLLCSMERMKNEMEDIVGRHA